MKQPIQSLSINTERDDRSVLDSSAGHSPFDTQSDYNLSPETPDENIDFNLVYALFAFEASVDGQANVIQGESLMLLDDSNSYWWLIRVLRDNSVGYLPAENIETPYERLARLNRHRNQKLFALDSDMSNIASGSQRRDPSLRPYNNKNVSFQTPFMPEILGDSDDDYYTDDEDEDSSEEGNNKKNNLFKKIFGGNSKKPKSTPQTPHQLDSLRNNSVTSDFNSTIYNLDQVQKLSTVDISAASTQNSHEVSPSTAIQVLTVHTGNIDLSASWKPVVTSNQTVILDMIEESLEKFDLEECTSSNYYVVVYDSEEQAVYRLDDYDSPAEVIECIHEGTFQVPANNRIQDSIYMYLSSHLTTSANVPNVTEDIMLNRNHSLTFYLNRKLRTVRKDEEITLRFPIQMITIQESGQRLSRMCVIKAKPSTMVVDFLKLALSELEIDVDEATQLANEYQVSLSTSDLERPLPFDGTLTTVFHVILNNDVDHEREDILFVIRKNHSPQINPLSLLGENIIVSQTSEHYEKGMVPVIEETYDSDSEETESLLQDHESMSGSKLNVHQMSIRLSIIEHDKDDISEVLDDVINDYNDEEDDEEAEAEGEAEPALPQPNGYFSGNNSNTTQFMNANEDIYPQELRSIDSAKDVCSETIKDAPEPVNLQTLDGIGSAKPENGSVVSLRTEHQDGKRPSSTEIKTRAIVSSVLRRIAPPPKSPPPLDLIARRKNSAPQILPENPDESPSAQDDTDDQIIANLIINTQLIKTVCSEELAEDVPLADLHGHQILDKQAYLTSSESLVGAPTESSDNEITTKSLPQDQSSKELDVAAVAVAAEESFGTEKAHKGQSLTAMPLPITVEIAHENTTRQSSGDSPIAYLEEYLGTMRSQSVRRKNKDDEKVVKLEKLLGRAAPSRPGADISHKLTTSGSPSSKDVPLSSPRNMEPVDDASMEPTSPQELRQSTDASRPDSSSSEVDGSIGTDSSGLNSQACKLLPLYNIQQTNDSGVALYYNDDEINNLILLVRGAVRFDYDSGEADDSPGHRKESEQGDSINQEVRSIFASTEEHLQEIEQELDKVLTAIVNVF